MEDSVFRRARHVITEVERTVSAAQALRLRDFTSFGLLMLQTHNSLRDDYEVSCPEVDELVEVTMTANGVYGTRITGGGFGGCTVSLCSVEEACGRNMAEVIPTKQELLKKACVFFKNQFNNEIPSHCASAPGRVNIIGEHTDYNNGYVFPMALPMVTIVVGRLNNSSNITLYSLAESLHEPNNLTFKIPKEGKLSPGSPKWANYCKGVIANFHGDVPGFDAVIISSVPVGGGVSSSASLEVAMYTFLEILTGNVAELKNKALACQKAEHEFANMPCGIMDQYASVFSRENHLLLLDCEVQDARLIEHSDPNLVIMVINSNVKHKLSGSEYPSRRNQCMEAASIMKLESLREGDIDMLEENKNKMEPVVYRRARHVVTEIARVLDAVQALIDKDYKAFGYYMVQSHYSLKYDFEVTCPELDALVDIAMKTKGVYGSRMTGGGFGGCTVTLLESSAVADLVANTKKEFKGNPTFYITTPCEGAKDEVEILRNVVQRLSNV